MTQINIENIGTYSTEQPDTQYAALLVEYGETDKTDNPTEQLDTIDTDKNLTDLLNGMFDDPRATRVEHERILRVVAGQNYLPEDALASAMDTHGRVRAKNARYPGERIEMLLGDKDFAFCGEYKEMTFFSDGRRIIAVKGAPEDVISAARSGELLKNISRLASTPASKNVFKEAKITASKSVIDAKNLYVIDMRRCKTSEFVMTDKKAESKMFLPVKQEVADVAKRLARRIAQRERQETLEAQRLEEEKVERVRREQEERDARICDKCGVRKGEHNYCRPCRRVSCASEFLHCRRCGKVICCARCSANVARGRSGAPYCSTEHDIAAEPAVRKGTIHANQRRA